VMTRAQAAAIETMCLPNRVCDFDEAAQAIIEGAGLGAFINHRTGHGIGLAGHEYPDDTALNYRPLAPGMVFSAEPGIYFPDHGGVRHDDTVFVTDGAPEVVTQFPKDRAWLTVRI
jgi:Xaa-Pro aminopeptidase